MAERPKSLLFVCIGNTCRGPMAEALAKRRWPDCRIESVGTNVVPGTKGPAEDAVLVMHRSGLDIRGHRPRSINDVNLEDYQLVVALDKHLPSILVARFGVEGGKIVELHVDDPISTSLEKYSKCANQIAKRLGELPL